VLGRKPRSHPVIRWTKRRATYLVGSASTLSLLDFTPRWKSSASRLGRNFSTLVLPLSALFFGMRTISLTGQLSGYIYRECGRHNLAQFDCRHAIEGQLARQRLVASLLWRLMIHWLYFLFGAALAVVIRYRPR
jgi:hypothetical protein